MNDTITSIAGTVVQGNFSTNYESECQTDVSLSDYN